MRGEEDGREPRREPGEREPEARAGGEARCAGRAGLGQQQMRRQRGRGDDARQDEATERCGFQRFPPKARISWRAMLE